MTILSKLSCMNNKKSIIFILIKEKVFEFSIIILIKYIDIMIAYLQ